MEWFNGIRILTLLSKQRNRDESESQKTYDVFKTLRKRYSVKLEMPAVLLPSAETVAQNRTTDARKAEADEKGR
ncbi:hypothetical protein IGI04_000609 [Brassica rapa subsp. trilocularis]|uniref:Uncharacterized protein n=1 Tax=Brassica rapa subsp. trilocularis TaxID=1813537 RepID=A0ABQ7NQB2_BRACM|nr:hypothetical protein IGI04_000609 [Brassica rapa subsp. trilocularis]